MAGFDNTSTRNFTVDIGDTDSVPPPGYGESYSKPTGSVPSYNEFQFVSGDTGNGIQC